MQNRGVGKMAREGPVPAIDGGRVADEVKQTLDLRNVSQNSDRALLRLYAGNRKELPIRFSDEVAVDNFGEPKEK
jgi:hypothetical protein